MMKILSITFAIVIVTVQIAYTVSVAEACCQLQTEPCKQFIRDNNVDCNVVLNQVDSSDLTLLAGVVVLAAIIFVMWLRLGKKKQKKRK